MYRKAIIKGLRFLRRVQNADKGIPATVSGVVSGCWTSGETLETLLLSPFHDKSINGFALDLIQFLQSSQIKTGKDRGGWPLVIEGKKASTMATGHNLAALVLAQNHFEHDTQIVTSVQDAVNIGYEWLEKHQNADGGWGVEPNGGADGSVTRMISTFYALRAYFAQSKTVDTSKTVRDGIIWILGVRNIDNGFGGRKGYVSDPCNTARAITALLRSQQYTTKDPVIRTGLNYITKAKPYRKLWPLDTEVYVTEGAPGQTVYNSNTTTDVLEAYLVANQYNKNVENLVSWFIENQQDDGSWFLGANSTFVRDIKTWSTNEALYVLSLASNAVSEQYVNRLRIRVATLKRLSIALFLVIVFQFGFIIKLPGNLIQLWYQIPENIRNIIIQGVILALAINLISSFLYDKLPPQQKKRNET